MGEIVFVLAFPPAPVTQLSRGSSQAEEPRQRLQRDHQGHVLFLQLRAIHALVRIQVEDDRQGER